MWTRDKIFAIFSIIAFTKLGYYGAKKSDKLLLYLSTEVSFNSLYLQEHSIIIGPKRQTVDVIINVAQDLVGDPWVKLVIKSVKGNNYRTIFQYDLNICHVLGKQGTNNFVMSWINNFWKYGNLPKSCPIKKGNYSWCNLRAEKLNLPNFLPNGKYQINTHAYLRQETGKPFLANETILVEYK